MNNIIESIYHINWLQWLKYILTIIGGLNVLEFFIVYIVIKFKDLITAAGFIVRLLTFQPAEFQLPLVSNPLSSNTNITLGGFYWNIELKQWITIYELDTALLCAITVVDGVVTRVNNYDCWTKEQIDNLKQRYEADNPSYSFIDSGPITTVGNYCNSFLNHLRK